MTIENFTMLVGTHASAQAQNLDKALRSTDGQTLYTHEKLSSTTVLRAVGLGNLVSQARIDARDQKKEDGAKIVYQSMVQEFGKDFSDRVLSKLTSQTGKDYTKEVTGQDLQAIKAMINTVQTDDLDAIKSKLAIVADKNVPLNERNEKAAALKDLLLKTTPIELDQIFSSRVSGSGKVFQDLIASTKPDGSPLLSYDELKPLALKALSDQLPKEKEDTFLRGNTVASKLLTETMKRADNGAAVAFESTLMNTMIAVRLPNDQLTSVSDVQNNARNMINALDTQIGQFQPGKEIQEFLDDFGALIDQQSYKKMDGGAAKEVYILRALLGTLLPDTTSTIGPRPQMEVVNDKQEKKMVDLQEPVSLTIALFQKALATSDFRPGGESFMNDMLPAVRANGSGFQTFLGKL